MRSEYIQMDVSKLNKRLFVLCGVFLRILQVSQINRTQAQAIALLFTFVAGIGCCAADEISLGEKYQQGMRFLPHKTIVVCSDNSELYLKRLRSFSQRVFGEKVYRIVDGTNWIGGELATLAYFGHQNTVLSGNECLRAHPTLSEYAFDRQSNAKRHGEIPDRNGGLKKMPISSSSFVLLDKPKDNIGLFVALCFNETSSCPNSHYHTLLGLNSNICHDHDFCE